MIPAAMRDDASRGRRHAEAEHPYRGRFQRDRDRIIHSAHFRRLEYKTQVFVNGEGDNYRTRLTHTLEVTQIARSIARALRLNEDLAEAVALSHDLGHTPFGHAGERVLNEKLRDAGGFNHNEQGLRIVDLLESRYAAFAGLNLTYEVREAFVRHGGREVAREYPEFSQGDGPLLEVAATLAADDIAYIAHDIDDGLFSGILEADALDRQELWLEATRTLEGFARLPLGLKRAEGVRRLINLLVTDVLEASRANLAERGVASPEDVRAVPEPLVDFSPAVGKKKKDLKAFLYNNFYRHPNVMKKIEEAQGMLGDLWEWYAANWEKMPMPYREIADRGEMKKAAADYLSGMTDRYAREKWTELFGG